MISSKLSRKGFTLTEMLMAVLILALMTMVIGGGVVVVKNAYEKITLRAEADTLVSTTISAVAGELRTASEILVDTDGQSPENISFFSAQRGYRIHFINAGQEGIHVGNDKASSPGVPLLTDKTKTTRLSTRIEITYPEGMLDENGMIEDADGFYFNIKIIADAGDKKNFREQEISIKPLN